jgi:hypothetical protein
MMRPETALYKYLKSKQGVWQLTQEINDIKPLWFKVTGVAISLEPTNDPEWSYQSLINFSVRLRSENWVKENLYGDDVSFLPEYTVRQLAEKYFNLPSTCGVTCLIESKKGKLLWPDDSYLLREAYWINPFVKKYLEQR